MRSPSPIRLSVEKIDFYVRNVRLRLPFRYGSACLVAAPLLHTRLQARGERGEHVTGACADMLPPKWFDKSSDRTFQNNVEDLMAAARIGRQHYLEAFAAPASVFDHWQKAYPAIQVAARVAGLNGLTGSFASSIIERAVMDAACKLHRIDFFNAVRSNAFGIVPGAVHEELRDLDWAAAWPAKPLDCVHVRHTIGLADPLRESDLGDAQRLEDGLPQTLEAWMRETGVRYLKIKVQGILTEDLTRLREIVSVAKEVAGSAYQVTLDGNEQFASPAAFEEWLRAVSRDPVWGELRERILFIEQPLDRAVALSQPLGALGEAPWPPIIIDESDDSTNALRQAVAMGYRGTSVKNCKGVIHALLNKLLVDAYNRQEKHCILSSEDLCNQPLLPLQQDLCTLSVLGVTHAERNGHHYVGTLDHIPDGELQAAVAQHPDLFLAHGKSARLRIRDGQLSLASLRQYGFGTAVEPSWSSMTPAEEWDFASLGL